MNYECTEESHLYADKSSTTKDTKETRSTGSNCRSALSDLDHVDVPVAVVGIEGFHRHSNQEITLTLMTNALAASRVAYAISLVKRMRDVIRQGGLIQDPLGIRSENGSRKKQQEDGSR